MGTIGEWSEERLNNWMAQRFNLQGNVRNLVTRAVADAVNPPGAVIFGGWTVTPVGYLACDGASYVRADYDALFSAIGMTYGSADASHFNVPDLQGRVPVVAGSHADVDLGDSDAVAEASRTPKHAHHKGVIRTGTYEDILLLGDPGLNAAGATIEVTPWATAFETHKHDVPAFDTDTAAAPYLVLNAAIKI